MTIFKFNSKLKSYFAFNLFSCAQDKSQRQWIVQILFQKLIGNTASDTKNIKNYPSYMQMLQALQLCQNLTIDLQQVF